MSSIPVLSENDLRMVLDTCRQVRNSGILKPGHFDVLLNRLPRVSSSDGTQLRFFKLDTAVVSDVEITGQVSTYAGVASGDPVTLINWEGLLDVAPEDYVGLFGFVDGEWVFVQGPCIA